MAILGGIIGDLAENEKETEIEWKIPHFWSLDEKKFFCCPRFTFANASWHLIIYPGGDSQSKKGFIPLYLMIDHEKNAKTVSFKLAVKNADGKLELSADCNYTSGLGIGPANFIERSELNRRKSELMSSDDTLVIICILKHSTPYCLEVVPTPTKIEDLDSLSEDFKDLFANKKSSDVSLRVKDKEFQAHKSVLVARSPVLAAMFEHDTLEKQTSTVTIDDCDPEAFEYFLRYLYSGKVEDIPPLLVSHLYEAAHKYDIQKLQSLCVAYMTQNLSTKNIIDVAIVADQYEEMELMCEVQSFFNGNMSKIFATSKWQQLMKDSNRLANKLLIEMASKK